MADPTSAPAVDSNTSLTTRRRTAIAGLTAASLSGCSALRRLLRSPTVSAPAFSRVGDPFPIDVSGVGRDASVVVTAIDDESRAFRRRFRAEEDGIVTQPRMLLSHLELVDDPQSSGRPPVFRAPTDDPVEIDVQLREGGRNLDSTTVRREYASGDIDGDRIRKDDRHFGTFYRPTAETTAPGVLVLHGSGGAIRRRMSKILASRGYPALALNYTYLNGHLWGWTPVEYLTDGVDWLLNRPEVEDGKVGVIGNSQGATGALLTGIHSSSVGAVVSYDSAPVVLNPYRPGENLPPSFTVDGNPVPEYENVREFWEAMQREIDDRSRVEQCDFDCFKRAYAALDLDVQAKNTFRVEEIDGPVLLLATGFSPGTLQSPAPERVAAKFNSNEWKMRHLAALGIVRLRQYDHDHRYEMITFEDSPHGFGTAPPYTAEFSPSKLRESTQSHLDEPATAMVRARAFAWPRLLDYLEAGIGSPERDSTGSNTSRETS